MLNCSVSRVNKLSGYLALSAVAMNAVTKPGFSRISISLHDVCLTIYCIILKQQTLTMAETLESFQ
jgi:hypothetical protein